MKVITDIHVKMKFYTNIYIVWNKHCITFNLKFHLRTYLRLIKSGSLWNQSSCRFRCTEQGYGARLFFIVVFKLWYLILSSTISIALWELYEEILHVWITWASHKLYISEYRIPIFNLSHSSSVSGLTRQRARQ